MTHTSALLPESVAQTQSDRALGEDWGPRCLQAAASETNKGLCQLEAPAPFLPPCPTAGRCSPCVWVTSPTVHAVAQPRTEGQLSLFRPSPRHALTVSNLPAPVTAALVQLS